ncbi:SusC/RagA family TonB-linked outer membrane protein [Flavobacterium pallidum]|uniref:SusC/RagA family protein n=1 Tax=Flavobacterium pallidum TaxID=2172098 RepID=A0A2S1SJV6_9FLAO|nr:TonB-dependent receptor [Flavobacterium pallidum]AWI26720.1 SusC/RagA family protein [Flavobacterium pallidum]
MKSTYALMYLLLFSVFGFAQSVDIGGTVKDEKSGVPMPGVSVQVKNNSKGTMTDLDGNYSLNDIPSGSIIVFSYVGYQNVSYTITADNKNLDISLPEDSKSLDEVIVIGYGTQRKKEVTGAVSVVSAKTLETLKPIDATQALQGTASGVVVNGTGGSPGSSYAIRIRGIATNGTNGPRIIVDGYDIGTDMNLLNPNDIETITVLKDVQAAVYGVIGANGIILVTTKKGKKNTAAKFSYNGYTGFQETSRKLPLLNATEYALLLNERYANGGQPLPFPDASGLGKGTDWQKEIFATSAPIISHDFSVNGGSEKITYAVSASDLTQEGIIGGEKSHYKRNSARIALTAELTSKLKLESNFIYTYLDRDTFNDFGLGSVLFNAINTPSTQAIRDANGDFTLVPNSPGLGIEIINPMAQLANTYNDYDGRKLQGTFGLDYTISKDLVFTARMGANNYNSKGKTFAKQVNYGGKVFDITRSSVSQNRTNDNSYTFDAYLTYKRSFAEKHNITGTFGTTIYKEWGNGLFATGYDVPQNSWQFADISLALGTSGGRDVGSYEYKDKRLSYFGRVQYDYMGKYLVSAMGRRDSSTRFGPNNSVAFFPSMTAGWVISKESFFGESKIIDFLKLRGSFGITGNDQIRPYGYVGQLNGEATYVFDGVLVNGTAIGALSNPDMKWEEAKKLDIGFDMNLLNNDLEINADYYLNRTDNLLIQDLPVSGTAGAGGPGGASPTINAGSVRNAGVEFMLNYNHKVSDNFKFGASYTLTTVKNEVLKVNKTTTTFLQGGSFGVGQSLLPSRMEEGKPLGYFYGYQTDGIFQNQAEVNAHPSQAALGAEAQPGDIRFKDLNGDGVINPEDRTNLGDPIPDLIMGFNLNFTFKGFDFAAYAYASLGNDMVRNYERTLSDANRLDYVLDRWTGEGTSNNVPRVTTEATGNNVFSNYFVEDASFLRIQNAQLGYTIKPEFTEKAGITKLRLYVGVNNIYTFTKYKGFDPGAVNPDGNPIGNGIDNGFYPLPRTYMFGVNLNF